MHEPEDSEELELVKLAYPSKSRKLVQRHQAYEQGRPLPLVCATIPIIGTEKIVELFRSPSKRVMGGEWIFFLSEHQKPTDHSPRRALNRGFNEELGYRLDKNNIIDPQEHINLKYRETACQRTLSWSANIYVVPIRDIKELNPDKEEILDVRVRPLEQVMKDVYRRNSPYKHFSPRVFLETLEKYTRQLAQKVTD